MKTTIVNVRFHPYDAYCGRDAQWGDTTFGNPYKSKDLGGGTVGAKEAIERYWWYFKARVETDEEFKKKVLALKGKRLGCHCKTASGIPDIPCHVDVIVEWLEGQQQ